MDTLSLGPVAGAPLGMCDSHDEQLALIQVSHPAPPSVEHEPAHPTTMTQSCVPHRSRPTDFVPRQSTARSAPAIRLVAWFPTTSRSGEAGQTVANSGQRQEHHRRLPWSVPIPCGSHCLKIRNIHAVFPDSGSRAQCGLPPTVTRLIDEPIDGLSDKLALLLPGGLGDSGQFVTLALRQVYLRSYHAATLLRRHG